MRSSLDKAIAQHACHCCSTASSKLRMVSQSPVVVHAFTNPPPPPGRAQGPAVRPWSHQARPRRNNSAEVGKPTAQAVRARSGWPRASSLASCTLSPSACRSLSPRSPCWQRPDGFRLLQASAAQLAVSPHPNNASCNALAGPAARVLRFYLPSAVCGRKQAPQDGNNISTNRTEQQPVSIRRRDGAGEGHGVGDALRWDARACRGLRAGRGSRLIVF